MVNPDKKAGATSGRVKARAQATAFTVAVAQPSLVTRTDLKDGGQRIEFPKDWHEINNHPKRAPDLGPYMKQDWHAKS